MTGESDSTRRATVPFLESILHKSQPVLDHGFVRVIDYMGDDSSIVQAARVSSGSGTKSAEENRRLIRYLMRHAHTSPFEMCEIKLHIKLPIFVARQWIRHRTASVNEYSGRYSVLGRDYYIPRPDVVAVQSTSSRQGRGEALPYADANEVVGMIGRNADEAYRTYERLLDGSTDPIRPGLARELARAVLPVGFYTEWYWKIDLHNLLHFLELRLATDAQYEIRAYAEQVAAIVAGWVPSTYEAFVDYRLSGVRLSRAAAVAISEALTGVHVRRQENGLTDSEWKDLKERFGFVEDDRA
jgi:thymidylate synthase (FAD)